MKISRNYSSIESAWNHHLENISVFDSVQTRPIFLHCTIFLPDGPSTEQNFTHFAKRHLLPKICFIPKKASIQKRLLPSVRFVKKEAGGSEIHRCNNILLSRN